MTARHPLLHLLRCPDCRSDLLQAPGRLTCPACTKEFPVIDGIPRFVSGQLHENFSVQWKKFSDVQLDSRNGTECSRTRLLEQSGLNPEDFAGKEILEVGCGAGRFTEVLCGFSAKMLSLDYSGAVEACTASNSRFIEGGRLLTAQADIFRLPVPSRGFDVVVGYGMLQHTGNAERALRCLWECVRPGGLLLVDRYLLSWSHIDPVKYIARPLLKRLPPIELLSLSESVCSALVPFYRFLLPRLRGGGAARFARLLLNRGPIAAYPLNLEAQGILRPDIAFRWSVLDTFDVWGPRYDDPCTFSAWKRDLEALPESELVSCVIGGQGNVGVVRRRASSG